MVDEHTLEPMLIPALIVQNGSPGGGGALEPARSDLDCRKEESLEVRCIEAFTAVHHFEHTHSLAVQNMGLPYLQQRADLINRTAHLVESLGAQDESAHDAVLLMDRVMSSSMKVCHPPPPPFPPFQQSGHQLGPHMAHLYLQRWWMHACAEPFI